MGERKKRIGAEGVTLSLFAGALAVCVAGGFSVLYALGAGLAIFSAYALRSGFALRDVLAMWGEGVYSARKILVTFVFIGVLTALWRAGGTIPVMVCYAVRLIRPSVFLLMAFLLNGALSVLTGTAFGTAATMGVVCGAMGEAMGVSPVLTGGAVLSGVYFGDRCSPVSTSALLVAELTGTDIFRNVGGMLKTALVPTVLSCGLYYIVGRRMAVTAVLFELEEVFGGVLALHWAALIPAALILILSLCRVRVTAAMGASILAAGLLCFFMQNMTAGEILRCAVVGYSAPDAAAGELLDGGGIVSMLRVGAIVCLSSAYAGIFHKTGLLKGLRAASDRLGEKITPFGAMVCISTVAGALACNQTLTIMLTHQICGGPEGKGTGLAMDLENSAVVIAPLIPWSIAGGVPLASAGAPTVAILGAFFLFLLPVWRLILSLAGRGSRKNVM